MSWQQVTSWVLSLALTQAPAASAAGAGRMTNAPNVRLRQVPAATGPVVEQLPLGTELMVEETSSAGPWYRVSTVDGRRGWVLGRLTVPFDAAHRDEAIEAIVRIRLSRPVAREAGPAFATRRQLLNLIERTASRLADPEAQARFALYRLRSLSDVAAGVPLDRGDSEPYRSWIQAQENAVAYASPAGAWMVDASYVAQVHDRHAGAAAADDIAWFMVRNGLRGECEGDVPCYLAAENQLTGQYLRWHPRGLHVNASLALLAQRLDATMDNLLTFPKVLAEFDPASRCSELHASLDPLVAAVTAARPERTAAAFAAIDRFARLCPRQRPVAESPVAFAASALYP